MMHKPSISNKAKICGMLCHTGNLLIDNSLIYPSLVYHLKYPNKLTMPQLDANDTAATHTLTDS